MDRAPLIPLLKNIAFVLVSFLVFGARVVWASPCCGQNSSSLNVMMQRQRLNVSLQQSQSEAMGRFYNSKDEFFVWNDQKNRQMSITQLSVSYKLSQKWQTFFNVGSQIGRYENQLDSGLSVSDKQHQLMDSSIGLTYELISEYSFSYYKPTVYVSAFTNVPTGHSAFEAGSGSENIAVSGHGQWGLGLGVTAQKVILPWSVMIQVKSLRLLSKDFENVSVNGFWDHSMQVMMGYYLNFLDLTLNAGWTQLELSQRDVTDNETLHVPNSRSTMLSFGLMKTLGENISLALSYNDQSLLGRPKNTLIQQSVGLNLSYNYF